MTVAFTGRYDANEVALLGSYLRPGSTALDIGASLGLYTLQLAELAADRDGRVVAIEPVPGNVAVIRSNLSTNGLDRVAEVHELALGASPGTLSMDVERGGVGNATVADGVEPCEMAHHRDNGLLETQVGVRVLPLDSVVIKGPVSVMKIDVEGFEMDVLAGAEKFIARHRPVILAEFNPEWMRSRGLTGKEPFRWAASHGYQVHRVVPVASGGIWQHSLLQTAPVTNARERGDAELLLVPAESDPGVLLALPAGRDGSP